MKKDVRYFLQFQLSLSPKQPNNPGIDQSHISLFIPVCAVCPRNHNASMFSFGENNEKNVHAWMIRDF